MVLYLDRMFLEPLPFPWGFKKQVWEWKNHCWGQETRNLWRLWSWRLKDNMIWSSKYMTSQAGNRIAGRNMNNLRYADDTTLKAGSEEELNVSWLGQNRRVKNLDWAQYSKNEDHYIWSHHFMANRWGKCRNSDRFYFLGLKNHCGWWLRPWN